VVGARRGALAPAPAAGGRAGWLDGGLRTELHGLRIDGPPPPGLRLSREPGDAGRPRDIDLPQWLGVGGISTEPARDRVQLHRVARKRDGHDRRGLHAVRARRRSRPFATRTPSWPRSRRLPSGMFRSSPSRPVAASAERASRRPTAARWRATTRRSMRSSTGTACVVRRPSTR
jgi:hypothetical protein